jgi:hypothetical protein
MQYEKLYNSNVPMHYVCILWAKGYGHKAKGGN